VPAAVAWDWRRAATDDIRPALQVDETMASAAVRPFVIAKLTFHGAPVGGGQWALASWTSGHSTT